MKDSFKFDYFYGSQAEQFSFFRLPKILIRDARFKKISSDAKFCMALCWTECHYPEKINGWIRITEYISFLP